MAKVDMNSVQFYEPRLTPPFHHQFHSIPPQAPTQNHHVISSVTQALSVPEKLDRGLGSSDQLGYSIEAKPNRRENVSSQPETNKDDVVGSHDIVSSGHGFSDDVSDNDYLPTIEELLRTHLPAAPKTTQPSSEPALLHPETSALYHRAESILARQEGKNRGSQEFPVFIEDHDACTDVNDEVQVASSQGDGSRAERNSSQPVDSSAHDFWYDVEAGCYIDESPRLSIEEQDQPAASIPAQDYPRSPGSLHGSLPRHINEHDDVIARIMPEKLVVLSPNLQDEAVKAMRGQDDHSGQQADKFQPQRVAIEFGCIHNGTNDDGDEDPGPRRRRLSIKSIHEHGQLRTSGLEEQEESDSFPPGPSHMQSPPRINQHNDSGIYRSTSKEPAVHSPTEPQTTLQVTDANQDWEIRKIIDKEDVDGVPHYLVVWSETLLHITSLRNAMELVNEFEARLRAQHGVKRRLGGSGSKRAKRSMVEPDSLNSHKPKRLRASSEKKMEAMYQGLSRTVLEMREAGHSWDEICAALRR